MCGHELIIVRNSATKSVLNSKAKGRAYYILGKAIYLQHDE